jgi:hypothetical protein
MVVKTGVYRNQMLWVSTNSDVYGLMPAQNIFVAS